MEQQPDLRLRFALHPPIITAATQNVRTSDAMTTTHEYVPRPGIVTAKDLSGSKKSYNCTRDTIDLTECSDTKKSNTCTKERENLSKPLPFFSHSFFNIIKWSSKTMTTLINDHDILQPVRPSEYFVAIPRKAAIIIQKRAPGPPAHTAVATPTIFSSSNSCT